ncbi:MAG: Mur ligase family protein [Candidatus Saccharibacteria bacterium]|nr:Mur ligase family protein [Candidatus Saccharibacteria bacterium]
MKSFLSQFKVKFTGNILDPYFCLWSKLYLYRWKPRIILITGSVGKTTMTYLLQFQFGKSQAYHSYRANSKIGIACDLLNLPRPHLGKRWRWGLLIFYAPLKSLITPTKSQSIYLLEYDIYDMYSTKFFKFWLKPETAIWVNVSQAHLEFFDTQAKKLNQTSYEVYVGQLAKLVRQASQKIFALKDSSDMRDALSKVLTPIDWVGVDLIDYQLSLDKTAFIFKGVNLVFAQPLPKVLSSSLALMMAVVSEYNLKLKTDFSQCHFPPSRNNLLKGIKGSYLLDSTFNAQIGGIEAIFDLFSALNHQPKWVVVGDIIEQGQWAEEAHLKLAQQILDTKPDRIFLIGRRIKKYAYDFLIKQRPDIIWQNELNHEFVSQIKSEIKGGELILFKGAGYLNLLVKALLLNPKDQDLLNLPEDLRYRKIKI